MWPCWDSKKNVVPALQANLEPNRQDAYYSIIKALFYCTYVCVSVQ